MSRRPYRIRILNFIASFALISCSFLVYRYAPHAAGLRDFTNRQIGLTGNDILTFCYIAYSLLLLSFYLLEKAPRTSKSVAAWRALRSLVFSPARVWRGGWTGDERLGFLSVLLKGFYAPIMLLSLFEFTSFMFANGTVLFRQVDNPDQDFFRLFNSHGFWFLFQVILFLDVLFFTVGYLVEHPALKNEIRSVDSTLLGWVVALACYPPFNQITARLLGGNIADFPQFETPLVHLSVNLSLLLLMSVYTSASVALNLKASNLTHRGIISHGPYRYVRHPAYAAKNLAWWLGSIPALAIAWERSLWSFSLSICCVAAWTALYALRAITEEAHLCRVNGEYEAYCLKVRYRFIPGVY